MTDDRTLDTLDRRGRAAAAGVRTAVAERPAPAFDPDVLRIEVDARPDRSRRIVPLLAAAAAVLVVVAAIVALAGTGDPDSAPADRVAPGDLRPYALAAAPDGFGLTAVVRGSDAEVGDTTGLDGPATVYGPDPLRPSIAAGFVPGADAEVCDDPEGCEPDPDPVAAAAEGLPEVDLGDRRAWDAAENIGGAALLVDVDGRPALVFGPTSEADAVRDAARSVRADGEVPVVADEALPDGWSEQGQVPLISALGAVVQGRAAPVDESGWALAYGPVAEDGEEFEMIGVNVEPGGPLEVGLPGLLADEVEEVEVRGHAGQLAQLALAVPTATRWWTLRWEERPGEVVEVAVTSSTDRFDRADVLAMAEGLVVVGPDEIDDLRDEAREGGLDAPGVTVIGEGRFSDGAGWTLFVEPVDGGDGSTPQTRIRTDVESASGTAGVSMGAALDPEDPAAPEPFPESVNVEAGPDYGWVFARVRDDVATVEVRGDDDERITTVTTIGPDGFRGVVAQVPADLAEVGPDGEGVADLVVVALAADGTELGRLEL